jgi:hypothetical protein
MGTDIKETARVWIVVLAHASLKLVRIRTGNEKRIIELDLVGYNAVSIGKQLPQFRKSLLPLDLGYTQ